MNQKNRRDTKKLIWYERREARMQMWTNHVDENRWIRGKEKMLICQKIWKQKSDPNPWPINRNKISTDLLIRMGTQDKIKLWPQISSMKIYFLTKPPRNSELQPQPNFYLQQKPVPTKQTEYAQHSKSRTKHTEQSAMREMRKGPSSNCTTEKTERRKVDNKFKTSIRDLRELTRSTTIWSNAALPQPWFQNLLFFKRSPYLPPRLLACVKKGFWTRKRKSEGEREATTMPKQKRKGRKRKMIYKIYVPMRERARAL